MFAPIGIPAGAALGLLGGGVYGAVASESWQEPEETFRKIVANLDLNRTLPMQLAAFAQSHGYPIRQLETLPPGLLHERSSYADLGRDGIETVIEIEDLTVYLVPAEFIANPLRKLILSAAVRLIRTADGAFLDDRAISDELGPALALDVWSANDAARFRQEVQQASSRLAEKVVSEYFMVYRFPERVIREINMTVHLKGLAPTAPAEIARSPTKFTKWDKDIQKKYSSSSPAELILNPDFLPVPSEFLFMAPRSNSYQPTMAWEPFSGTNVTYDLRVWRAGRVGPEALVYDRASILEASHRLEVVLEPSTLYYWSVRAHFSEEGKERMTEWSRRSASWALSYKILSMGLLALFPDPVCEGFYVFITPPPGEP